MSDNRRLFSLIALLALGLPLGAGAQQQCKIQKGDLTVPHISQPDHVNNRKGDYLLLSLSWSPSFCTTPAGQAPGNKFQCQENSFGFVVHGLWPETANAKNVNDHPRNCTPTTLIKPATLKQNLCTIPGVQLMQDEWAKHGTCAFKTPEEYFGEIHKVVGALHIPDVTSLNTVGAVVKAFVGANKGLTAEDVQVQLGKGASLVEVHVCYSNSLEFHACEPGASETDQTPIKVTPKAK